MKLCERKYYTVCEGESWAGVMNEPDEANIVTRFVLWRRALHNGVEGKTGQEKTLKKSKWYNVGSRYE
jgi:hypothetical protein